LIIAALFYVFGAALTGAWSTGIQGIGRDRYDVVALFFLMALWPAAWLLAFGQAVYDWAEGR
jgi:hypothetical protein